jgi:hypothetical protein
MKRPKISDTPIGKLYPFYLENKVLRDHYLYQVVTPEMLPDYTPLLTLVKISERVHPNEKLQATKNNMYHGDLLAMMMRGSRKDLSKKAAAFIEKSFSGKMGSHIYESSEKAPAVFENGTDFPLYEMDPFGTRLIVCGIRDLIRKTKYQIRDGALIDILLTQDTFGVFKIVGVGEGVKLQIQGVYNMADIARQNPLNLDLSKVVNYPKKTFTGETKNYDLFRAIRSCEWRSFE